MDKKIKDIIEKMENYSNQTYTELSNALTGYKSTIVEDLTLSFLETNLLLYYIKKIQHQLQKNSKIIEELGG